MLEIKNLDALELSEALLDTYKCVHGFGFNGHFISLIPTKNYYYLAYKHRDILTNIGFSNLLKSRNHMKKMKFIMFYRRLEKHMAMTMKKVNMMRITRN